MQCPLEREHGDAGLRTRFTPTSGLQPNNHNNSLTMPNLNINILSDTQPEQNGTNKENVNGGNGASQQPPQQQLNSSSQRHLLPIVKRANKTPKGLSKADFDLVLDDVDLQPGSRSPSSSSGSAKFINTYTEEELAHYFDRWGIRKSLNEIGFKNLRTIMDTSDDFVHRVSVTDITLMPADVTKVTKDNFLLDVFVRLKFGPPYWTCAYQILARLASPTGESEPNEELKKKEVSLGITKTEAEDICKLIETELGSSEMVVTCLEWLAMQNPLAQFDKERPRLPGQNYPGLKIGYVWMDMILNMGRQHGRDAFSNTPEHFHNAVLYWETGYKFLNPCFEGYFLAMLEDLLEDIRQYGVAAVAWAFKNGNIIRRTTQTPEIWKPQESLYPLDTSYQSYFASTTYKSYVRKYFKQFRGSFYIDWEHASDALAYSHQPNPNNHRHTNPHNYLNKLKLEIGEDN